MKPTIGKVVTYYGFPAIVTALGDNVCTVVPLAGGDQGCQNFGIRFDELSPVEGDEPAPTKAPPGVAVIAQPKPKKSK